MSQIQTKSDLLTKLTLKARSSARPDRIANRLTGKGYPTVQIPRLKNNVQVCIPRSNNTKTEFIAEVNLWSMGVRYNLHRLVGEEPQLYVVNA
ncbi:hypothetical protein LB505_007496 [Fusarium chuoi]|nr:hypothetical protein LB505_007496 [Fusarium chuoi]